MLKCHDAHKIHQHALVLSKSNEGCAWDTINTFLLTWHDKKNPHLNNVICNNMAKICSYKSFFQMHFISMGLNEWQTKYNCNEYNMSQVPKMLKQGTWKHLLDLKGKCQSATTVSCDKTKKKWLYLYRNHIFQCKCVTYIEWIKCLFIKIFTES